MNIPEEAVEAAAVWRAVYGYNYPGVRSTSQWDVDQQTALQHAYRQEMRIALEAAAPFIAAQALRDAADKLADVDFEPEGANTPADVGVIAAAKDLRKWADELGPR